MFLLLANERLDGCLNRRAELSGSAGYSRSLFGPLTAPGQPDVALILPEAVGFGTQHTECCRLDFWHGAMGSKKSERGFLDPSAASVAVLATIYSFF